LVAQKDIAQRSRNQDCRAKDAKNEAKRTGRQIAQIPAEFLVAGCTCEVRCVTVVAF